MLATDPNSHRRNQNQRMQISYYDSNGTRMTGKKRNHKIKETRLQNESNNDGTNVCFHFLMSIENERKWSSTVHFFLSSFHDLTFEFHFCTSTTPVNQLKKSKVASFSTFHFSLFTLDKERPYTKESAAHVFFCISRLRSYLHGV